MNKLAALTINIALLTALAPVDVNGDSGSDYWPTQRGPDATGAAKNGNPPLNWSEMENIKWKVKLPGYGLSSPVVWAEKIFFLTAVETDKNAEATSGKANFVQQSLDEIIDIYASPIGVADRVYFMGRNGVTQVIKHSDEFQVLVTNKLDDNFDASPAIVGDELFLKGKTHLYCIAKP